jgi:hypothetical protein
MANLTITSVRLVRGSDEVLITGPVGEVATAGQYFRLNTTTGKLEKGNGTTTGEVGTIGGVILTAVATINLTGSIAKRKSGAILDLGEALAAMAFDAPVYLSDTDATLADTAGTVSTVIGRVVPGWNATTADKLLLLD